MIFRDRQPSGGRRSSKAPVAMTRTAGVVVVLACLCASQTVAAQTSTTTTQQPPPTIQVAAQTLTPPDAPGSWVLQVISQGGIMGTGAGDFVIASDGTLSCLNVRAQCPTALAVSSLRQLEAGMRSAVSDVWQVFPPSSLCRDCLTTTLILTSRNADGTLSVMRAGWDPTTRSRLAAAIVQLHDLTLRAVQPLTR